MRRHGIELRGVIFDSIFSSDGVIPGAPGFLKSVVDLVHAEGGVYIADEVQPGFCRTGKGFWGFERHGIVPDIVTMGKPMANGIACSGMAIKHEVLDAFARTYPYFNTFAGNPVAMAAALAVLHYLKDGHVLEHVDAIGDKLVDELLAMALKHPVLGDVRGTGLFVGVDIVFRARPSPTARSRCGLSSSCARSACSSRSAAPTAACSRFARRSCLMRTTWRSLWPRSSGRSRRWGCSACAPRAGCGAPTPVPPAFARLHNPSPRPPSQKG